MLYFKGQLIKQEKKERIVNQHIFFYQHSSICLAGWLAGWLSVCLSIYLFATFQVIFLDKPTFFFISSFLSVSDHSSVVCMFFYLFIFVCGFLKLHLPVITSLFIFTPLCFLNFFLPYTLTLPNTHTFFF